MFCLFGRGDGKFGECFRGQPESRMWVNRWQRVAGIVGAILLM